MFKTNLKSREAETAIVRMILRDGLKAGDPILSENKLAALLGVSRVTIRQAIARLAEQRVLHSENGRGTFIVKIPESKTIIERRSGLIGFVCYGGIDNTFMASVARGIEEGVSGEGMQLCVGSSINGPEHEAEIVRNFIKLGVDGIIISPIESNPPSPLFLELCRNGVKMVVVDEIITGVSVPAVACDDREGGFLATDLLIKAGHKRIAHICGPRLVRNSQDRLDGYRRALEMNGLPFDSELAQFATVWSEEAGRNSTLKLLELPPGKRPTAIFAANDLLALTAWNVLKEHGLSVPDDISLVGYGNLREPYEKGLLLTSVDQQPKDIGRNAWILLKRLLSDDLSVKSARVLLKPELIERRSVSLAKNRECV